MLNRITIQQSSSAMFSAFTALLFSLFSAALFASDYVSHQVQSNKLVITTTDGVVEINALNQAAFEVHYQLTGVKQLPSFAIDKQSQISVLANTLSKSLTIKDSAKQLMFSTSELVARIDKSPLRISYQKPSGELIAEEEQGFFSKTPVQASKAASLSLIHISEPTRPY